MTVSHGMLLAEIQNIQKDTKEIKDDYKTICEQVNKNRENIASHKSVLKIIETFLVGVGLAVIGLFFGKYR